MLNSPKHLAIIMDGNGRWATQKRRPRIFGHIKGAQVAKKVITECVKRKLSTLTLYAFSSENWSRPASEVNFLMKLLYRHIRRERATLQRQNIRFTCIGDIERLPKEVQNELRISIEQTSSNTGMNLIFALSYGGRQEIVEAAKRLAQKVGDGELRWGEIDETCFRNQLQCHVEPDLVIRTSGESRISNFLLWQSAYSELYFTKKMWPDFTEHDLQMAFHEFGHRDRRFGRVDSKSLESSL